MFSFSAIAKTLLFWWLVFMLQAIVFFVTNLGEYNGHFGEFLYSLYKSMYMNLAAATTISAITLLLGITVELFGISAQTASKINRYFTVIILISVCLLTAADLALYKVWGSKINGQALSYLKYPKDILPTIFVWNNIKYAAIGMIEFFIFYFGFTKFKIQIRTQNIKGKMVAKSVLSVLFLGVFVIIIRGGVKSEVLNRNHVFHSPIGLLNYTSLNSFWNFMDVLMMPPKDAGKKYAFFSSNEAKEKVEEMHTAKKDTTEMILNTPRPNVVFILLESMAADVVECVGGEKGVAPKFGKLAEDGILFNRFYSTGYRTEQGLLAILSSVPAQPVSSIIHSFGKFDQLPNIYKVFNEEKYHTSYYFGGRLSFDNVEAYLRSAGVQHVMGESEIQPEKKTKWGGYDEEVFAFQLKELNTTKQPFFSVLATLTSHEWFDAEVPKWFGGDADHVNDDYRNTVHYTDSCLAAYLQEAKKQSWYKNTVFVIMADHACKFPKHRNNYETERHHIPLLITGGAIKPEWRNKVIDKVASHIDIAATILKQTGMSTLSFPRSKNLFNPYEPAFAWYAFDNGFGLVSKDVEIIYDNNQSKTLVGDDEKPGYLSFLNYGKAYMQYNFAENNEPGKSAPFTKKYSR